MTRTRTLSVMLVSTVALLITAAVALAAYPPIPTASEADKVITGTSGNDRLRGTRKRDHATLKAGNDTINTGKGVDVVYGDNGRDTIRTGPGRDYAFGGNGRDTLRGGSGVDLLAGEGGKDTIIGGPGDDDLHGGKGADTVKGGPGNDLIDGSIGFCDTPGYCAALWVDNARDILVGGPGNDSFTADRNDKVYCGAGTDSVYLTESGGSPSTLVGCEQFYVDTPGT